MNAVHKLSIFGIALLLDIPPRDVEAGWGYSQAKDYTWLLWHLLFVATEQELARHTKSVRGAADREALIGRSETL